MDEGGDGGVDCGDGVLEDVACAGWVQGVDGACDVLLDGGEHEGELGVDEFYLEEDDPSHHGFDLIERFA